MDEQILNQEKIRLSRLCTYHEQDPNNVELMSDIFETALTLGELEIAQSMVTSCLLQCPRDAVWEHRQALIWMAQGKISEAKTCLLALAERGLMKSGVQYNLAYIAFVEKQFEQSAVLSRELLSDNTVAQEALFLLIRVLHHLRRFDEALELMERFKNTAAMSANALGAASLLALDYENTKLAQQFSMDSLAINPLQLEALVAKGTLYLTEKKISEAIETLTFAQKLKPDDGRTESALGFAFMLNSDTSKALAYFSSATRNMPQHIGTWIAFGWCLLSTESLEEAKNAFQKAVQLDRNFSESYGGLAVCFIKLNDLDSAKEYINLATRLDANSMSAQYAKGLIAGETLNEQRFKMLSERILKGQVKL